MTEVTTEAAEKALKLWREQAAHLKSGDAMAGEEHDAYQLASEVLSLAAKAHLSLEMLVPDESERDLLLDDAQNHDNASADAGLPDDDDGPLDPYNFADDGATVGDPRYGG